MSDDKAKDDKSAKPGGAKGKAGDKPSAKPGDKPGDKPGARPGKGKGDAEATPDKGDKKGPSRVRRIGIAVLVVIALLGISFLGGWLKGRGAMTDWRERAQTAERLATLYETRHELDEAWHAIDEDNFGRARKHVGEAAKVLGKGPEDADLRKLAKELAEVQIVVSDDSRAQQEKLQSYMQRLDQLAEMGGDAAEGS